MAHESLRVQDVPGRPAAEREHRNSFSSTHVSIVSHDRIVMLSLSWDAATWCRMPRRALKAQLYSFNSVDPDARSASSIASSARRRATF
jgi:hypothetical protein